MLQLSSSAKPFRAPRAIFWTALGLRLAVILLGHTYRVRIDERNFNFGFEAGRIARSLVTGHGYGNPFNGFSGPSAWLPPLFPLLMALAFKLFGVYSRGAAFFILAADSLFSALIAPAIYEIAARCFDAYGFARRRSQLFAPVATWSAWTWALYPAALQYAVHWLWEMSLSTCLFTWALVFTLRLRGTGALAGVRTGAAEVSGFVAHETPRPSVNLANWAVLGVLWGFIALSNASLIPLFAVYLLWALWPELRSAFSLGGGSVIAPGRAKLLARPLAGAVLAVILFIAALTPWVVRNERALGAFVPTRANLGVELWQSTHFYFYGIPWGGAMPMWAGDPDFQRYVRMGEVRYAAEKGAIARARIRAHPGLFLRNTGLRFQFFWFGVPSETKKHPSTEFFRILNYSFTGLAGVLGLGLALRRRVPGVWLMAWCFAVLPLPYYIVTVQARFRHPLEPLIAILAVYLFRSTSPKAVAATS